MRRCTLGKAVMAAIMLACVACPAPADVLNLQGSGSFINEIVEPYQAQIEALSGHKLKVQRTTSAKGVLAVLRREADLAMVSAKLETLTEPFQATNTGLPLDDLREFRVGGARVAFPVHPSNPVRRVSLAQFVGILSGHIANWRELGGPDLPIHVVSTPGSVTRRMTEVTLFGGQPIAPRHDIPAATAEKIVASVAGDPGALGITQTAATAARHLPELQTKILVERSHRLISLKEPSDAMHAVIAATRRVIFEEAP